MRGLSFKKFLTIMLFAVALPVVAEAQYRYTFRDSLGVYKVEFTPHKSGVSDAKRMSIPVSVGAHEIRLGSSYSPYTTHGYTPSINWNPSYDFCKADGGEYSSSTPAWYTLGVEGGRWFKEWLYFGGAAVWTGGFDTLYDAYPYPVRSRLYTYTNHNISLMPIVRFAWLRRGIVQLYSGVGLGMSLSVAERVDDRHVVADVAFDVTFFGISVGRNFFGYLDIGAGSRGVVSFGVGYRFNRVRR
jgi:hypothetical protein